MRRILSLVPLAVLLAPLPTAAQDGSEDRWKVEGEIGASVFFGNTSQTAFTSGLAVETQGRRQEFAADASFFYGEASTEDGGARVNKRSWRVTFELDPDAQARVTPFLSGKAEGSYEKRIDLRWNTGLGGRWRMFGSGPSSRLEVSVALLAERTLPSQRASDSVDDELEARWSARLKGRRVLSEGRVTLQTETHYQPAFDRASDFTLTSRSSVAFRLTEVVSLKMTFVDNYDSGAEARGARTNNDGQLVFGVLSAF